MAAYPMPPPVETCTPDTPGCSQKDSGCPSQPCNLGPLPQTSLGSRPLSFKEETHPNW